MFYAVKVRHGWINFSTGFSEAVDKPGLTHLTQSLEVASAWASMRIGGMVMYELKEVE